VTSSEQGIEDLLSQVTWRLFGGICLLDRRDARDKVHFLRAPEGLPHVQRPADPEAKKDGDVDVRSKEILRIPLEKDLVAIEKDEDRCPKDTPDGDSRLKRIPIRELGAIAALRSVSAPELDVGQVDGQPCEEAGCGREVNEPVENFGRTG